MKIVHICHNYIDGQTYQDNELPQAHARLGHDVTVISTLDFAGSVNFPVNRSMADRIYTEGACKIVRLPLRYPADYRFASYKGLYEAIEQERPALIYFHGLPYFCYYDIIRYKKRHGCKLAVDFHCDFYNSSHSSLSKRLLHGGLYRSIIHRTRRYVDQYYGVTPGTIDFVETMYHLPAGCVKLLPLGGNLHTIDAAAKDSQGTLRKKEDLRAALGLAPGTKLIVSAGKLDKGKKAAELAAALAGLDGKDFLLLLIGPVDETYRLKIEEAARGDVRVRLTGWMAPSDLYRCFLAADLGCFPGSQSVIWQQAICCGLPLLCRYWPGSEYLDSGGNVRFLAEPSVQALRAALSELLADEAELDRMAAISRTLGRSRFSYDRIAQTVLDDLC